MLGVVLAFLGIFAIACIAAAVHFVRRARTPRPGEWKAVPDPRVRTDHAFGPYRTPGVVVAPEVRCRCGKPWAYCEAMLRDRGIVRSVH